MTGEGRAISVTTGPGRVVESGPPPREPFPVDELSAAYDQGAWRSVRWLTAGKNDHARVTTDRRTFFLRRSYRSKSPAALRWQIGLLHVLRGHGLPVPRPLPSRDGAEVVALGGRFYLATGLLPGDPYDPAEPAHIRAAGRTLAEYHRIAAGLPMPEPAADRQEVLEAVLHRLALLDPADALQLHARSRELAGRLEALWPHLPTTVIHGGCRRGSLLFTGIELTGVLDFDSARSAVRVLDLAIALHDVGKVYTALGRADHKVALDLGRVERFLAAYGEIGALTPAETEALPLLIAAKRAQRALGRAARLAAGAPLSENDVAKVQLETARLEWLADHREELAEICAHGVARSSGQRSAAAVTGPRLLAMDRR